MGVASGKCYYETIVTDEGLCRVGWSTDRASHELGGLGWAGLGWAGLGWAGLGWAGLGWAGLGSNVALFICVCGTCCPYGCQCRRFLRKMLLPLPR